MTAAVQAAIAAIAAARRPVEFKRIATDVSNALAPDELAELYRAMDGHAGFREAALYWRHFRRSGRLGRRPARHFASQQVAAGLRLFETPGLPRSGKTALILVSGYGGRLMLPVALLLDCLPQQPYDVLFLRSPDRSGYRTGVEGLGNSLYRATGEMEARYALRDYQKIQVLGTSGGGLPALQIANLLGAHSGISVGGQFPFDALRLGTLRCKGVAAFHHICACMPQRAKRLICAYSDGWENDVAGAKNASLIQPGIVTYPVAGMVSHGFMHLLFRYRMLETFLEKMLGDQPDPAPLSRIAFAVKGIFPRE